MTLSAFVGIIANMRAALLIRERIPFGEDAFAELVLWRLSSPVPGSSHQFRYRLAFMLGYECVLRYDNETGKGDHRHTISRESKYVFESPEKLIQDFLREARRIYREDSNS